MLAKAGLLPVTQRGWHCSEGKQGTSGMGRPALPGFLASSAPKPLRALVPVLSHKLCPFLRKHRVAQTVPEGSFMQGRPGDAPANLSCRQLPVLGDGLFNLPTLAGCHPLPGALAVVTRGGWICTGTQERLGRLHLDGDQIWGSVG